jgi:hypothetical protein
MAANTKYTPAPTRDSFEEPSYSQAPPSYQAETAMPAPRSEGDNVPDDFKVGQQIRAITIKCITKEKGKTTN